MPNLNQDLQEVEDDCNAIIAQMQDIGVDQVGLNFMDKCLRPTMQGVVVAHHSDVQPEVVEDAIANIFLIGMRTYFKRRYVKRADAVKAAQEAVNELAKRMSENIELDFPEAPSIIMPFSGKIDG